MKKLVALILQFLLFVLVYLGGSFAAPFHLREVLSTGADGTHVVIWDGALLMTLLFVVILLIEAVRRRIRSAGSWTVAAFVLAAAAGLALRFGFMTL